MNRREALTGLLGLAVAPPLEPAVTTLALEVASMPSHLYDDPFLEATFELGMQAGEVLNRLVFEALRSSESR